MGFNPRTRESATPGAVVPLDDVFVSIHALVRVRLHGVHDIVENVRFQSTHS